MAKRILETIYNLTTAYDGESVRVRPLQREPSLDEQIRILRSRIEYGHLLDSLNFTLDMTEAMRNFYDEEDPTRTRRKSGNISRKCA